MRDKICAVVVGIIWVFNSVHGSWNRVRIGTCPTARLEEIEVGQGRNDGINRVYVGAQRGIYEWTFSGGRWSCQTVHTGGSTWYPIAIGKGRNDDILRVYSGEGHVHAGDIIEATFSGGAWSRQSVQTNVGNVLCVRVGDARNDGVMRLYAGGQYFGLYEYTWTGTNWRRLVINSSIVGGTHAIGDGRNDGVNRIYSPHRMGLLYEFSWTGSSFSPVVINLPNSWLCAVAIGQGRNDGINRIYVSAYNGHLYEVTYSSGGWQVLDMTPGGPNKSRYGICVGRTRSDGKYRVYTTTQGGAVTEFSWDGTSYKDSIVDAVSGATACLTIGVGRNDDTVRIYATNWSTGAVYEFTHTSPYAVSEENAIIRDYKLGQNTPNPFTSSTEICFTLSKACCPAKLRVYDLTGKLITTLAEENKPGVYKIKWNAKNSKVLPGVYFYRLEGRGFSISKKLILL